MGDEVPVQADGRSTPLFVLAGFLVTGAVLGAIPSAWLMLYLTGTPAAALDNHPVASWANGVWPRCFAVVALATVLTVWCGRRVLRAWKAYLLVSLLVLPTVPVGSLLLVGGFTFIPGLIGGLPIFAALLWGMLSFARWIILKTCPEAGPLTAARDRWVLLPFAVIGPALLSYAAGIFHLYRVFTPI